MTTQTLLVAVLVAAVAVLVLGLFRRRLLARIDGTIEVSLRLKRPGHGRGWVNGVGLFVGDHLYWYRVFSLSVRARKTYARREFVVLRRREPTGAEHRALLEGAVVLECRAGDVPVELAMARSAVTGFLAWLEARPPGATLPV